MGDTDSPDFNKARGFLIGYSLVVTLLWFFGADLTHFKLMGNEVYLKDNIRHVWLVIAIINVYLWFRFYQRLPKRALCFDENMHAILDAVLIKVCKVLHQRKAFKFVAAEAIKEGDGELVKLHMSGYMKYRGDLAQEQGRDDFSPTGPWDFPYPHRVRIRFSLTGELIKGNEHITSRGGREYAAVPSKSLYRAAIVYAFLKGAVELSWFTDNIWPLVLGFCSISIALYKWWQINHVVNIVFKNSFSQILMAL